MHCLHAHFPLQVSIAHLQPIVFKWFAQASCHMSTWLLSPVLWPQDISVIIMIQWQANAMSTSLSQLGPHVNTQLFGQEHHQLIVNDVHHQQLNSIAQASCLSQRWYHPHPEVTAWIGSVEMPGWVLVKDQESDYSRFSIWNVHSFPCLQLCAEQNRIHSDLTNIHLQKQS